MLRNVTFRSSARSAFGAAAAASLWLTANAAAEVVSPQAVGCKLIRNAVQLHGMRNNLAGSYCLANDIDAGSIVNFQPIGDVNSPFTGKLFGNGRVIRNLRIDSGAQYVGLFGYAQGALIQDVGLVNADITGGSFVGGLIGAVNGTNDIRRVHVTGRIVAVGAAPSSAGGIAGAVAAGLALTDSWSSAAVSGDRAGGAIGSAGGGIVTRVYAAGPITCPASSPLCYAGGLIGIGDGMTVTDSYASGPVIGGNSGGFGGLFGAAVGTPIRRSHALGPVTAGGSNNAKAGGLVGILDGGSVAEAYAAGRVAGKAGAILGGLIGASSGTVTSAYWDTVTSDQAASAAGVGYTTTQLRKVLPPGFGNAWAITRTKSYPFLNEADIDFAAPLATLVNGGSIFTFLPIEQFEEAQYATPPTAAGAAALAAVHTMIARAIGVTGNVKKLKDVKIDRHFWNDAKKVVLWRGPVTTYATLGVLKTIAAGARLNGSNVIGEMKIGKLVILRGAYTRSNGVKAEHWLLGTLYTALGNALDTIVANDPWTGLQVTIDPLTKKIVSPANFPLTGFKVDGYRPVTLESLD